MLSHRGQMTLEDSLQLLEDYDIVLQEFVANIMPAECRYLQTPCRCVPVMTDQMCKKRELGVKLSTIMIY